jgi:AcrR family transcriptional regulator
MSPRPYHSEPRQVAASETRARIVEAARSILTSPGPPPFTVDAVAERAGVARMTVYHQFGSKRGLVEAVSDDAARQGGLWRLPEAFKAPDALDGLRLLIETFMGFWASQRDVIRGLKAHTPVEPDLGHEDRNAWRLRGITRLLERLTEERGRPSPGDIGQLADLLQVLTSFEAFESLSAGGRTPAQVAELIDSAARALLGP